MRMLNVSLLLLGIAGLCQAQSDQPSLGDLARQNKPAKKAVLVVGEDDFPHYVATDVGAGSGAPTAGKDAKMTAAAGASEGKSRSQNQTSSAKDSRDVAGLKKQLEQLKSERDGWKQSAKEYEKELETETNDFRRETYEKALSNDKQNVEICQQQIDQAQADLSKAEKADGSNQKTTAQK